MRNSKLNLLTTANHRWLRYLLVFAVIFALVWLFAGDRKPSRAQSGLMRFAVVDTEKILLESNVGKSALADLKKMQEGLENQMKQKAQALKDLTQRYNDGKLSLSQDKLREMQQQITAGQTDLKRFQDDATRQLNKNRDEMLASIDTKVMPVIQTVGKEMKMGAIFRKYESGLIYTDDSIDLTSNVINRLNSGPNAE